MIIKNILLDDLQDVNAAELKYEFIYTVHITLHLQKKVYIIYSCYKETIIKIYDMLIKIMDQINYFCETEDDDGYIKYLLKNSKQYKSKLRDLKKLMQNRSITLPLDFIVQIVQIKTLNFIGNHNETKNIVNSL